jgi:hypothetical protein
MASHKVYDMRDLLKRLFGRTETQQLGLEVGPRTCEPSKTPYDSSWLYPPNTLVDPAPWDKYWSEQIAHGVGDFVHLFCEDGDLVDTMRANGFRTVLCVGNGISQEPRALAWAGFDVTVLDLSPFAMKVASEAAPPAEFLAQLVGGRSAGPNGDLKFVVGDLCDAACCPGPYDVVIERLTLQLYLCKGEGDHSAALQAVANRLASPGIFFSQSHDGAWKPSKPRIHWNESYFRANDWPIWPIDGTFTTRVAWLFTTTG